jgi:hypothetical protein
MIVARQVDHIYFVYVQKSSINIALKEFKIQLSLFSCEDLCNFLFIYFIKVRFDTI